MGKRWHLAIHQHKSAKDKCQSAVYLLFAGNCKAKASCLHADRGLIQLPSKRKQSFKRPWSLLLPTLKRLLEPKLIFWGGFSSIFGTTATPCFGDWHSVNSGQLATAVYCNQLLFPIEVVASLLTHQSAFSVFSPLSLIFTRSLCIA